MIQLSDMPRLISFEKAKYLVFICCHVVYIAIEIDRQKLDLTMYVGYVKVNRSLPIQSCNLHDDASVGC